ncbi:MAG: DUF4388 domain-containing protein [Dictyoglomaceae bacterium]|nr:DUF4388 domain-containing protein [Dictyoglomaceae bacterium]
MSLRGDLLSLPLWEVLQLLSSGRKTGKFQVEDNGNIMEVFFKEGRIVYAKGGNLENLDALLDLALWSKGSFVFIPDEEAPTSPINLDPFEVLISSGKYIDLLDYLGDFLLIPINMEGLSEEEKNIVTFFDGKKSIRDVINEISFLKIKSLELINKLIEKKKLIRIDEDENLFWFYIFWRSWNYILEEFPKKGLSERNIKRNWKNFLDKSNTKVKSIFQEITFPEEVSRLYFYRYMKEEYIPSEEEVKEVFENMTAGEKVLWDNIYKNVKQFSASAIKDFSKVALRYLFSLGKTTLDNIIDASKSPEISDFITKALGNVFVYIGKKEYFEEQLFSWFLDGERSLEDVIEDFVFDDLKTRVISWKLIENRKIIAVEEDKKLQLIYRFWKLWKEVKKEYKGEKWEVLYRKWERFLENNVQDIRYVFDKIILNLTPNWEYIYKNLSFVSEEEIRGFLKNLLASLSLKEDGVLGEKIRNFKMNL